MTEVQTGVTQTPQEFVAATPEDLKQIMRQELTYKESAHNKNNPVRKIFILEGSRDDALVAQLTDDNFRVVSLNEAYYFSAGLSSDNVMQIMVRLIRKVGNQRIRSLLMPHYSDLFDIAINYFKGMGRDITGIRGVWSPNLVDGGENTNFAAYQTSLQQGASRKEAALSTPTGKLAKSHGYTHPSFVSKPIADVDVIFYRHPPAAKP